MTLLGTGEGTFTGNTGMEWWLILASSRWHRWVRWWAPAGRPPTPGCRSSRRRSSRAPTPDSSPCRWWLRSSQTNLRGSKTQRWEMLFTCQIRFLCSEDSAGRCLPECTSVRSHPTLAAMSHAAHLPNSEMAWSVCPATPLHSQHLWHFNSGSWPGAPGVIPVWLSGHLGSRRCSGTVQPANLGCWKGLPREDTMDWQWSRSLAERAWSTMDKWSIKPLETGSDPLIEFPATEKAAGSSAVSGSGSLNPPSNQTSHL